MLISKNIEFHHGGNHLLENLISLCMGSIFWETNEANKIYDVEKIFPSIYLATELSRTKL